MSKDDEWSHPVQHDEEDPIDLGDAYHHLISSLSKLPIPPHIDISSVSDGLYDYQVDLPCFIVD